VFAFKIKQDGHEPEESQVVREGEVRWLMDSPEDPVVLHPTCRTRVHPGPPGTLDDAIAGAEAARDAVGDQPAGPSRPPGSGDVSAGDYFRESFRLHK